MPETAWTTIVDHAKKCKPGKDLYSYFIEGKNVRLFFNSMHQLVGATFHGRYTDISNLDQSKQTLVEGWRKAAYEDITDRQPDYEMENGQPKPIDGSSLRGACSSEPKDSELRAGNHDKVHHQVDQQGTSPGNEFFDNYSPQHTLTRLGSVQVLQLPSDDVSFDICSFPDIFLDANVAPYYQCTTSNDVLESATLDQVIPSIPFTDHAIPVSQGYYCRHEPPPFTQCTFIHSPIPLVELLALSRINSFNEWSELSERNQLGQEIGLDLDGNGTMLSASGVSDPPPPVLSNAVKLLEFPKWLKLTAVVKCLWVLKASKRKTCASAKPVGVPQHIEQNGDE